MNNDTDNRLVIKTFDGLEGVLATELQQLGAQQVEEGVRMVSCLYSKEMMYKANLHLRTALRILKPIASFKAEDSNALYKYVRMIDWGMYMDNKKTFAVEAVVANSPQFPHSQYVALKTKDAVADWFRVRTGFRPSVDTEFPHIYIHVHINGTQCNILLDSSGVPLFKRGYRMSKGAAPLNEVLAAGIILLSGWDAKSPFMDFMCGSGTIPIEAAMMAQKIAPNLYRPTFGFQKWNDFDSALFRQITEQAQAQVLAAPQTTIVGSDLDADMVIAARGNIRRAKVDKFLNINAKDMTEAPSMKEGGTIIINPPYGERMRPDDLIHLYKMMGNTLKQNFQNCKAFIFTGNEEASKSIGLHSSRKLRLFNGSIECLFLEYELYQGSKKAKFAENSK